MDKLKNYFILALLLFSNYVVVAQSNDSSLKSDIPNNLMQEKIYLHLNSNNFITGETMLYKLYCVNNQNNLFSPISKIAYFNIFNKNKEIVYKNKIFLKKGEGQGDFFIPTTLATGNYKLVAYTRWMLNSPRKNIFETNISIINPFQAFQKNKNKEKQSASLLDNNVNNIQHHSEIVNKALSEQSVITLDKKNFQTREKVILKLNNIASNGNYSIGVRKIDELSTFPLLTAEQFSKRGSEIKDFPNANNSQLIIPEIRGEIISGSIKSKNSAVDISNKSVALSLPGQSFALKITKTNQLGNFNFILDQDANQSNCIVQILEDNSEEYTVQIDELPKLDRSLLDFPTELVPSADKSTTIQRRSVASQIDNAYYHLKKDSLITPSPSNPFFHSVEKKYNLDEYTRFPSLKETITEVLIEVYYKRKGDKYSLHLRDNTRDLEVFGLPLVVIDGAIVNEFSNLFNIDMNTVSTVSIVNKPYVYGPNLFGGIISFKTKNSALNVREFAEGTIITDIVRPSAAKFYFNPDYANGTALKRIPDYRHQLLWLPELNLNEKDIIFYTSDVTGEFGIVLEGFTNQGIPISVKENFVVK